ncbi:MAG: hypothetical protein HY918_02795, partial [Candidatus Doudnabacteria bacterium]|nr:hypothetical protein [Candidatus Doudnabacteria bacterium]
MTKEKTKCLARLWRGTKKCASFKLSRVMLSFGVVVFVLGVMSLGMFMAAPVAQAQEVIDVTFDTIDQNGNHVDGQIKINIENFSSWTAAPFVVSKIADGSYFWIAGRVAELETDQLHVALNKDTTYTIDMKTQAISQVPTLGKTQVLFKREFIDNINFDTIDQ